MKDIDALLNRWIDGSLDGPEIDALLDRIGEPDSPWPDFIDRLLGDPGLTGLGSVEQRERLFRQLMAHRDQRKTAPAPLRLLTFRRAAAILILLAAGSILFIWLRPHRAKPLSNPPIMADIAPGHTGAILHLSNGSAIVLDSAADGAIANQAGVEAIKTNGELKYSGTATALVYNTISTERGRQWQLTLPDGTRVWLDAASSIRYPIAFTGATREVEITGQAYFEVVHNARQPFRVRTGSRLVEDVGTRFNINAYADEPAERVTLAEGAVRIGAALLKPGQAADIINDRLTVVPADIDQALAWKNGLFDFNHADLPAVLRQLARWYDIDVKFEGRPPARSFHGKITRDLNLSQVINILQDIEVKFRIEGKTLIVTG